MAAKSFFVKRFSSAKRVCFSEICRGDAVLRGEGDGTVVSLTVVGWVPGSGQHWFVYISSLLRCRWAFRFLGKPTEEMKNLFMWSLRSALLTICLTESAAESRAGHIGGKQGNPCHSAMWYGSVTSNQMRSVPQGIGNVGRWVYPGKHSRATSDQLCVLQNFVKLMYSAEPHSAALMMGTEGLNAFLQSGVKYLPCVNLNQFFSFIPCVTHNSFPSLYQGSALYTTLLCSFCNSKMQGALYERLFSRTDKWLRSLLPFIHKICEMLHGILSAWLMKADTGMGMRPEASSKSQLLPRKQTWVIFSAFKFGVI